MKKFIIGLIVIAVVGAVIAEEQKKSYDPDLWLKNSLRLNGLINGTSISKEKAEWLMSLPPEIQINVDSAIVLPDVWRWVSKDERVVILFAGNMKEGNKILDIRGK